MTLSLDDLLNSLSEDTGVVKAASAVEVASSTTAGSDAAAELENTLTKKANETEVNTPMATPQEKGHAIADSILSLVKQAMDGLAPTAPENRLISETAAQVAHSSAGLVETDRSGTMTQVLQSLVANSAANGAVRDEALAQNAAGQADETTGAEGVVMPSSDGSDLDSEEADEVEKVAAVVTLVDNGFDFDTAVEMVKAAAEEIEAEEFEQVKVAAVNRLMDEGLDLESAVQLVKEASRIEAAKETLKKGVDVVKGHARSAADDAKALFTTNSAIGTESRKAAAKALAKNPLVYGTAGAGAAMATGAALAGGREKKAAAIEALVDAGYTVSQALEILGE